jgi:hypothetical protein
MLNTLLVLRRFNYFIISHNKLDESSLTPNAAMEHLPVLIVQHPKPFDIPLLEISLVFESTAKHVHAPSVPQVELHLSHVGTAVGIDDLGLSHQLAIPPCPENGLSVFELDDALPLQRVVSAQLLLDGELLPVVGPLGPNRCFRVGHCLVLLEAIVFVE